MSPLPSSGELKFSDIATEFGGAANSRINIGIFRGRGNTVPANGAVTFPDDFYNADGNAFSNRWQYTATPTGGNQTVTVPPGVFRIRIAAWGAGGGGTGRVTGGGGGYGSAYFRVEPGEVLKIYVGGRGVVLSDNYQGASGGGYSGVYIGSTPLLIAGAGAGAGGRGNNGSGGFGGAGGGEVGQTGGDAPGQGGGEGTGGTQTQGGVCISRDGDETDGAPGTQFNGGDASGNATSGGQNGGGNGGTKAGGGGGGGGGGSGWYGGAGGERGDSSGSNEYGGGGAGGGSTYINKTATTPSGVTRYISNEVNLGGNFNTPGGNTETDYNGTAGAGGDGTSAPTAGQNGLLSIRI